MEPLDGAPVEEAAGRSPSPLRRRLGVTALVVAAALGGVGYGVAWADDDPEPAVPAPAVDGADASTGGGCEGGSGPVDRGVL
jgi:hypothetical protein